MKEKIPMKEKSLLSLYIFEILRKYSSKESPLSEKQIKEKLNAAEVFLEEIKEDDSTPPSGEGSDRCYLSTLQ